MPGEKTIFTIGHSTHPLDKFIEMLQANGIQDLADVRNFPGSKKFPQFNKEALNESLRLAGIEYHHFKALGGRRKPLKDSKNTAWRNDAFRGYADYMETEEFQTAIVALEALASIKKTAYMCSEAVWWRCHRSLISDYLKVRGWKVLHILSANKVEEHPFTSPARIVDGKLLYADPSLF